MSDFVLLKDLLVLTKDGEWGSSEPMIDSVKMYVIRGTDFAAVRYGDLSNVPIRYISERLAERKQLQTNDILIETAGGTKGQPTGRTVFLKARIFESSSLPITCASFSRFLRVNPTLAVPEYVYWYLQFLYNTGKMEHHQIQHTGVARFQYTRFAQSVEIPLPSLYLQNKIADILSNYDRLIDNNSRRIALLEESIHLLYQEWFVRSRFPGYEQVEVVDGVPEGWRRIPATQAIDFSPKTAAAKGEERPYVAMEAVSTNSMILTGIETRAVGGGTKFKNGDTLLARITPCLENGKTAFVQFMEDDQMIATGSTEFIVMRSAQVTPYWVYCLARSHHFRQHAINSMAGSDGRQRVKADCFAQFQLILPPSHILKYFDEIAAPIYQQIKSLSLQNEKLKEGRDRLLPRLMNGSIAV